MLCSIEVRRDRPIETAEDTMSISFVKDVRDWGKIAGDIIVWDYVIQFNNLLSPFPKPSGIAAESKVFCRERSNSNV